MVLVRCAQTDLPKAQRKPVTDAVRALYERIVDGDDKESSKKRNKAGRLGDYVQALKQSLDKAYQPDWHVMAGNSLGFACKNCSRTVGVWHILDVKKDTDAKDEGRLMVVIWKSPGIEVPLTEAEREADVSVKGTAVSTSDDGKAAAQGPSLHLVQPAAAEVEVGSEMETAIGVLRDSVCDSGSLESVELSKLIRRRLTRELGTIWHVAVGREFVVEPAANRRNFVLATFGKDMHIVCFQHEQKLGSMIDSRKVISALPWLLVTLICFGYMAFHNICEKDVSLRGQGNLAVRFFENKVCSKQDWELEFGMMAMIAVAVSFVAKKWLKNN